MGVSSEGSGAGGAGGKARDGSVSSSSDSLAQVTPEDSTFELRASADDLKRTLAYVKNLTIDFVRKCRIEHLKRGCRVRWVVATTAAQLPGKRATVAAALQKSSFNVQSTV